MVVNAPLHFLKLQLLSFVFQVRRQMRRTANILKKPQAGSDKHGAVFTPRYPSSGGDSAIGCGHRRNVQKMAEPTVFIPQWMDVATINSFACHDDFQDTSKLKTSGEVDLPL
jgi:hypothetical protein